MKRLFQALSLFLPKRLTHVNEPFSEEEVAQMQSLAKKKNALQIIQEIDTSAHRLLPGYEGMKIHVARRIQNQIDDVRSQVESLESNLGLRVKEQGEEDGSHDIKKLTKLQKELQRKREELSSLLGHSDEETQRVQFRVDELQAQLQQKLLDQQENSESLNLEELAHLEQQLEEQRHLLQEILGHTPTPATNENLDLEELDVSEHMKEIEVTNESLKSQLQQVRGTLDQEITQLLSLSKTQQQSEQLMAFYNIIITLIMRMGRAVQIDGDRLEVMRGFFLNQIQTEMESGNKSATTFVTGLLRTVGNDLGKAILGVDIDIAHKMEKKLKKSFEKWIDRAYKQAENFFGDFANRQGSYSLNDQQVRQMLESKMKGYPNEGVSRRSWVGLRYAELQTAELVKKRSELKLKEYLELSENPAFSMPESKQRELVDEFNGLSVRMRELSKNKLRTREEDEERESLIQQRQKIEEQYRVINTKWSLEKELNREHLLQPPRTREEQQLLVSNAGEAAKRGLRPFTSDEKEWRTAYDAVKTDPIVLQPKAAIKAKRVRHNKLMRQTDKSPEETNEYSVLDAELGKIQLKKTMEQRLLRTGALSEREAAHVTPEEVENRAKNSSEVIADIEVSIRSEIEKYRQETKPDLEELEELALKKTDTEEEKAVKRRILLLSIKREEQIDKTLSKNKSPKLKALVSKLKEERKQVRTSISTLVAELGLTDQPPSSLEEEYSITELDSLNSVEAFRKVATYLSITKSELKKELKTQRCLLHVRETVNENRRTLTPREEKLLKSANAFRTSKLRPDSEREDQLDVRGDMVNLHGASFEELTNYIAQQRKKCEDNMVRTGKASQSELDELAETDPKFDVFQYANEVEKDEQRARQQGKSERSETYFGGEILTFVQTRITRLKELTKAPIVTDKNLDEFNKVLAEIQQKVGGPKEFNDAISKFQKEEDETEDPIQKKNVCEARDAFIRDHERDNQTILPLHERQLLENLSRVAINKNQIYRVNPNLVEIFQKHGVGGIQKNSREISRLAKLYFQKSKPPQQFEGLPLDAVAELAGCKHDLTKFVYHPKTGEVYLGWGTGLPKYCADNKGSFLDRMHTVMAAYMEAIAESDWQKVDKIREEQLDPLITDISFFPKRVLTDEGERNKAIVAINGNGPKKIETEGTARQRMDRDEEEYIKSCTDLSGTENRLADLDEVKEFLGIDDPENLKKLEDEGLSGNEVRAIDGTKIVAAAGGDGAMSRAKEALKENFRGDEKGKTRGGVAVGVQRTATQLMRKGWDIVKRKASINYNFIDKNIAGYSTLSVLKLIQNTYTQIAERTDFSVDMMANRLGMEIFAGTLLESEFKTKYQNNETERMEYYKKPMSQFGNDEIRNILFSPIDMFQLKAAFIEMKDRGILMDTDWRDPRTRKALGRFAKTYVIQGYSLEEQDCKKEMQETIRENVYEAVDALWGKTTAQTYRQESVSKMESEIDKYKQLASGQTPKQKADTHRKWYRMLVTGQKDKLLEKMHPSQLVGFILQDIDQGDNDCYITMGVLQALIIEGVVTTDMLRRIQSTNYTNTVPIHALIEGEQAKMCGLADYYHQHKLDGLSNKGFEDHNPFFQFFYGQREILLDMQWNNGKWTAVRSIEEYNEAAENGLMQRVPISVRDFQLNRQAQPEGFVKMDNAHARIFQSSYEWGEWDGAVQENQNGIMPGRNHDYCSALAGYVENFSTKMEAAKEIAAGTGQYEGLSKEERVKLMNISFARAFKALAKTHGVVSKMNRHHGKSDFRLKPDGTPNEEAASSTTLTNNESGNTNYEKMILSIKGGQQRLNGTAPLIDKQLGDNPDLLIAVKRMVGFQFIDGQGIGEDGKKKGGTKDAPYEYERFNPTDYFKQSFELMKEQFRNLAYSNGLRDEINEESDPVTRYDSVDAWASRRAYTFG